MNRWINRWNNNKKPDFLSCRCCTGLLTIKWSLLDRRVNQTRRTRLWRFVPCLRCFFDCSRVDGRGSSALFRLCVFLLLHISWSVNPMLWLLVCSDLFMPPLLLPPECHCFMVPRVGVNVWWLASHPLCAWMDTHLKLSLVIPLSYWCLYFPSVYI